MTIDAKKGRIDALPVQVGKKNVRLKKVSEDREIRGEQFIDAAVIQVAIVNAKEEIIYPIWDKEMFFSMQQHSGSRAVVVTGKNTAMHAWVGSGDEKQGKGENQNHMKEKKVEREKRQEKRVHISRGKSRCVSFYLVLPVMLPNMDSYKFTNRLFLVSHTPFSSGSCAMGVKTVKQRGGKRLG